MSNCSSGCAEAWPSPTVESGAAPSQGPGVPGDTNGQGRGDVWYVAATEGITQGPAVQATRRRAGQVPYHFVRDGAPGDTNGQGVNDVWFVAAVSGTQRTAPLAGDAGLLGGAAGSSVLTPVLLALAAIALVAGVRARTARGAS